MTDDLVELLRCGGASDARAAARALLAVGLEPDVHRDGDAHVVMVRASQAEAAARALGVSAPESASLSPSVEAVTETDLSGGSPVDALGEAGGGGDEQTVEDDGFEVDERGYAAVALAKDGAEAHVLGSRLLEHGIGFDVEVADDTGFGNPLLPPGEARVLRVVEIEAQRAVDLLGVDPPRLPRATPTEHQAAGAEPVEKRRSKSSTQEVHEYFGGRLRLTQRQAVSFVVLYLLALVLIPLAFFYGVRYVLDDDIVVEVPTLPTSRAG